MIEIFVETKDCLTLIDNIKIENPISLNDGLYSITFIPLNCEKFFYYTLSIQDGKIKHNNSYVSCLIKDNFYYIYFDPKSKIASPQPISYFQQKLNLKTSHYFTAYSQNENYYFTLESENEIYNAHTLNKLQNILIRYSEISIGYLIAIKADILNQKYINVILYDNDYHCIFSAISDDIIINEDNLVLVDFIKDSMQRKIERCFSFLDNKYTEISRTFTYLKRSSVVYQTLPFLFCEALFCKDYAFCKKYTSEEKLEDFISLIGKFDKIINIDSLYKEGCISLLYNEKSRSYIKNFNFDIQNLYIENIIEL